MGNIISALGPPFSLQAQSSVTSAILLPMSETCCGHQPDPKPEKNEQEHAHHEGDHEHESGGCCDHDHEESGNPWQNRSLIAASVITVAGLLGEHVLRLPEAWTIPAYILGMGLGGWFLVPEAWAGLVRLRANINVLMVMASIGAAVIGAWGEAAVVVVLFGVAEWLEGFSVGRARGAISKLLDLAPPTARIRTDKGMVDKPVREVATGEIFEVRSGERIPLDAVVREGESDVNQAPITGEPLPVDKKPGDSLFAGTLNGARVLVAEVTKPYKDSTLAKISEMVQGAQEQRAPTQRFVEKFALYYTPFVPLLSLLVFIIPVVFFHGDLKTWTYRALTILVIACPCALVVATPVSIVCGLAALARRGVLIKGGNILESLGKIQALAVDKTGTITEGKPRVLDVITLNGKTREEILHVAASIDAKSSHPLALAVLNHAHENKIEWLEATDLHNLSGRGSQGMVDGHRYFVGNHRLTHDLGICTPELEKTLDEIQAKGHSVVVVGHQPHDSCQGEVLGILTVGDAVRPQASETIQALHGLGLKNVTMLSGDSSGAVKQVSGQVGIDSAYGDLLPDQKLEKIKELREKFGVVGMVGDGINDAPALATADFGIAMGAAGSDTAIETADIALMQDDLNGIAIAIKVSRRVLNVIKFNVGFALALKVGFLILGVTGYTSLWLAILADTGATVLVVANAMRLLRA